MGGVFRPPDTPRRPWCGAGASPVPLDEIVRIRTLGSFLCVQSSYNHANSAVLPLIGHDHGAHGTGGVCFPQEGGGQGLWRSAEGACALGLQVAVGAKRGDRQGAGDPAHLAVAVPAAAGGAFAVSSGCVAARRLRVALFGTGTGTSDWDLWLGNAALGMLVRAFCDSAGMVCWPSVFS